MPLAGQASGGWTESSSALRLLHVGVRNSVGILTADSFTQTNPPIVTAVGVSTQVDTTAIGVLSGSVAYARGVAAAGGGANMLGGPTQGATGGVARPTERPLGVFINNANGNAYENTPGTASGKGPYVSAQGTYGNSLYETNDINGGGALTYAVGEALVGSFNGYLTNVVAANNSHDRDHAILNEMGAATAFLIGVLKMAPDATQNELVYDQRI